MTTSDSTQAVALEELLRSPAESRDHECAVPPEFARESSFDLEMPAQSIDSPCSRRYTAVRDSGRRPLSQIGLIVVHCTESSSARSSAEWFANERAQGSAHLVVDDNECYRTLENDVIPWGAKGANTRGFHVEITGWARWTRAEWLTHERGLRRAAYKAAAHARKFGVPIAWLSAAELKAGERGFATHATCSRAFGGDHTDPGRDFPLDQLLAWTNEYAEQLS